MAAIFILLPITKAQTIEPSFETSYYEHEVRRTIIDWCDGQMRQVHDTFDWRYYNASYENWWYIQMDDWVCREGCDKHYSFVTWPDANTVGQSHRWGYGTEVPAPPGQYQYDPCAAYDETTEEPSSGSITYMGRQEWHTRRTGPDGYVWDHTYYDGSFLNLLTGGTPGVTNANNSFFAVTMHATDSINSQRIPNSSVKVWGRAADMNGDIWFAVLPDHAAVDVTPDVAGAYFHQESDTNNQATYEHQI